MNQAKQTKHTSYLYLAYQNPKKLKKKGKLEVARNAALYALCSMTSEYLAMLGKSKIKVIGTA